jgi:RHS repeat-associated protein
MNLSPRFGFRTALGIAVGLSLLWGQPSVSGPAKSSKAARAQSTRASAAIAGQTTTLLPSGKQLFIGGENASGTVSIVAVKDPQTGATTELKKGLLHARAWHTVTLLPDGTLFVFGGQDSTQNLVTTAEIFDPSKDSSTEVSVSGMPARAHHTATLLTDGRVLLAGGSDAAHDIVRSQQIWDPRSGAVENVPTLLLAPRQDHTATLTSAGRVLFWGGTSNTGLALEYGEVFDPESETEQVVTNPESLNPSTSQPFVEASMPSNGATNVALKPLIGVRFSLPASVTSVGSNTVFLSSNGKYVAANVVAAERGMLAFLTPVKDLDSGTTYTVALSGVKDASGKEVDSFSMTFTTISRSEGIVATGSSGASGDDGERGPLDNSAFKLPPLQAHQGETALAGKVLKLNGKPLVHVLLQIESQKAYTDGSGRFLIENIAPGHHVMVIDGSTANHGNVEYGIYDDGVDVQARKTNVLNYPIWMTPLDRQHEVTIASPTTSEFTVTNPALPGLELHLPPNTVIRDRNGNVVTRLSITPIPVNQPPFPLPPYVEVPIYFTIQPGGAYLDMPSGSWGKGAQLWYPNWRKARPGTSFDFWNYDPEQKGWYVYGEGSVSKDSKSVVPDAGVEIYQFTGAMLGTTSAMPNQFGTTGDPSTGGDPVSLSSGLFVYAKTDLVLPDIIPLTLERTYRPNDNQTRPFGIGTTHLYEMFIGGETTTYSYVDLALPDGSRIHFYRTSPGTSLSGATYAHTSSGTSWYGATAVYNTTAFPGASWVLTTKTGLKYFFPDAFNLSNPAKMALIGIQDRYGNTVTITRDGSGNVTQITSPNGRYIQFQHDTNNRITQAQDNGGRTVLYQYDAIGRLQQVTDAGGGVWQYAYDSNNNMLTIQDARGITYLTNEYDAGNHIIKQTQVDGSIYRFSWTFTSNTANPPYVIFGASSPGGSTGAVMTFRACTTCSEGYNPLVTQVDVTDPNGNIRRVNFNSAGYTTSDTRALGKPEEQTFTYTYSADNLLQTVTDPLGRVTTFTYDPYGNTTSVQRLSGTSGPVATSALYDAGGAFSQVTSATDEVGHTTTFGYDTKGSLVTITDPLGHQRTFGHNSQGQVTSVTDSTGSSTQLAYSAGDLVSTTDPLGRTITRTTDNLGRVTKITDAMGNPTQFTYNGLNQALSTTDALGDITSFSYDHSGNLLSVTDANQHTTNYTYDNMDRVLTRKDPLQNQEGYQYDGNGNLTQFTDRRGKVSTFSFDGLNRKTFAGYGTTAGPNYESTVSYTYDAGNRLTQVADSANGTITRGYDDLNRLTSDVTPQGTVGYGYDLAGRRTSLTVPGQSVVNYAFDSANRLTQITQGSSTVQFSYDAANRRTSLTLPNGLVMQYRYDSASQLTGLTYTNSTGTIGTLTYAYDLTGRRIGVGGSLAAVNLPSPISSTAYNANNQLTTWGTANLFYDSSGNMTSDGTHSYVWDARNRLSQIDFGNTAIFNYDAFGRRTSKTILSAQTGFLYDGANPVQELSGATVTANLLTGGLDEYFQRTDSTGTKGLLTDAMGSTLSLTNSTASPESIYTYEPFGNTAATGTASSNSLAYTGREQDATGLYFYRARYYSPILQRFISEDPLRYNGHSVNFYEYGFNSPTNYRDPTGFEGWGVIGGASAGIGAYTGFGVTGSTQAGAFWGGSAGLNTGVVASAGGFTRGDDFVDSYALTGDNNDYYNNIAAGASLGAGIGIYHTNATEPAELTGIFDTITLGLGVAELQLSRSNGIHQESITFGLGKSFGFFRYPTNTFDLTKHHCQTPSPFAVPVGDGFYVEPETPFDYPLNPR